LWSVITTKWLRPEHTSEMEDAIRYGSTLLSEVKYKQFIKYITCLLPPKHNRVFTIFLLQDYHILTFKATSFGRHAAIFRPVKS
jgi:hypothetical protein